LGTPGEGDFAVLPPPKRTYAALELSLTGGWSRLRYRTSYVLSRSHGNYSGLFDSDQGIANPGKVTGFYIPEQAVNTEGLLPNDRPHVLKLSAAYETGFGLAPGVFLAWMSGTPINDWVLIPPGYPVFLAPRGTAGRTPAVWDLNLRLAYAVPWQLNAEGRIVLDFLHLGNPQQTVTVDQWHYFGRDPAGNPTLPNDQYLGPTGYQPPMTVRVGVEITF
jgi:hypothetical protein